jgi:hypothetical protein
MTVVPRAYWEIVHPNFETGRVDELILHVIHESGTARIHIQRGQSFHDTPSPDDLLQQLENLQVALSQIVLEPGRIFPH